MANSQADDGKGTGRMLVVLAAVAAFMTVLGIAVVWALAYGPF